MSSDESTINGLATSLNFRKMRQDIIASNIANTDTPGFKAKRIDFEEALARALDIDGSMSMASTNEKHFNVGGGGLKSLKPQVYNDPNGVVTENGNTVNRDEELAAMAENKILYDASIQLLNKKLAMLKYAIGND